MEGEGALAAKRDQAARSMEREITKRWTADWTRLLRVSRSLKFVEGTHGGFEVVDTVVELVGELAETAGATAIPIGWGCGCDGYQ